MAYRLVAEIEGVRSRFDLRPGENLVGSGSQSDVRLNDPSVSRHHAVVVVVAHGVEVADLGSSNGTLVDGEKVRGKARLNAGQEVYFGTVAATLESVIEADLDVAPAAEIKAAPAPDSVTSARTTTSLAPLQILTAGYLPPLIDALAEQLPEVEMAQRIGAAMWAALPCTSFEVFRRDAGGASPLFTAGEASSSSSELDIVHRTPDFLLRVSFEKPGQSHLYQPLLRIGGGLLQASAHRPLPAADRQPKAQPTDARVPDPPTIDPGMQAIYDEAGTVALGKITVLILGSSGTGKEVLARYIHRASTRADKPFIALNCAALSDDLQESELFGIEKGVATGVDARPGKFELADGGTLFLDEIGDMAPSVQSKILRVLQEGEIYRVGGTRPIRTDVRVIAATNRDIAQMLAKETFRSDLYHRIADWEVTLPDLKDRRADIANLAVHFLAREAGELGRNVRGFSKEALRCLEGHDWPGNIRELEREVARAALFVEEGGLLDSNRLSEAIRSPGSYGTGLKEFLAAAERGEIVRALNSSGGDMRAAAEELQISLATLYRKKSALGIRTEDSE